MPFSRGENKADDYEMQEMRMGESAAWLYLQLVDSDLQGVAGSPSPQGEEVGPFRDARAGLPGIAKWRNENANAPSTAPTVGRNSSGIPWATCVQRRIANGNTGFRSATRRKTLNSYEDFAPGPLLLDHDRILGRGLVESCFRAGGINLKEWRRRYEAQASE